MHHDLLNSEFRAWIAKKKAEAGASKNQTRSVGQLTYDIQLLEKRNRMLQLMAKVCPRDVSVFARLKVT